MDDRARSLVAVLLILAFFLPSGGCCSLIGVSVGAVVDARRPHGPVPSTQWDRLEPGRRVEITRQDGSRTFECPGPDSTLRSVPREEINGVSIPVQHPGMAFGYLIGMMLDATVLIIVASQDYQFGGLSVDR
jgi:hypothetical protein